MEPTNENDAVEAQPTNNEDSFEDAIDAFPSHDSFVASDQSDQSTSASSLSSSLMDLSPPASTLRRRINSLRENADIRDAKIRFRKRRNRHFRESDRVDWARVDSVGRDEEKEGSTVTAANDDRDSDSVGQLGGDSGSSGWLLCIAAFVIKAIGFQFNLFVNVIMFPVWVLYNSYMLVVDPLGVIRRCRVCIIRKLVSLCKLVIGTICSFVSDWLKEHKTTWKLLLGLGWGLLWAIYVGVILCGLLVLSIIVSGFLMRFLVEKPLQMRQDLNFDYTKNSPVAYVPIRSCPSVGCGVNCNIKVADTWGSGPRIIPPNHKVQVSVSLTLPESEYNRNLGMFQVRVEFLSADGKILYSKSHPCMLKFKSQPVQVVTTVLKVAPLVTGYVSESQKLHLKIRGFTEGKVPTSCIKVTIEQRAEFQPGAGIPEIYDATLSLESELPFFKRIVWYWKKTMFVWITIISFLVELLFTLVCCRTLLIPRGRETSINNSVQSDVRE